MCPPSPGCTQVTQVGRAPCGGRRARGMAPCVLSADTTAGAGSCHPRRVPGAGQMLEVSQAFIFPFSPHILILRCARRADLGSKEAAGKRWGFHLRDGEEVREKQGTKRRLSQASEELSVLGGTQGVEVDGSKWGCFPVAVEGTLGGCRWNRGGTEEDAGKLAGRLLSLEGDCGDGAGGQMGNGGQNPN